MKTYGHPSGQLFAKKWQLGNPNRTKSIMKKHKVKHQGNCDTKTGNRDHTKTTANELQGGLNSFTPAQPHPPLLMWYKHLIGCSVRMEIF